MDPFDGLLLLNPQTLFALRMSYPTMVYLTPLLRHTQPLREFLALSVIQAYLVDVSQLSLDHASLQWCQRVDAWTDEFFGATHRRLLDHIRWQVRHILGWLPMWMVYVSTLCWDEWNELDIDLQRLYVLLDYEHPMQWSGRILCNPKYRNWVAKLVTFCLRQWEAEGGMSTKPPVEDHKEQDVTSVHHTGAGHPRAAKTQHAPAAG